MSSCRATNAKACADNYRAVVAEFGYAAAGRQCILDDIRNMRSEPNRLRAQRPVDVEAVLAPVRRVLSAYRTAPVYGMKYELLARHVVDDLGQALAEAEKIGRGE